MPATKNFEQERREVAVLLASGIFNRAPGLEHLLVYVCEKYFEGEAEQIKEYNIAIEALGRSADFDLQHDSIVRVEAFQLRKRLSDYYAGPGAEHAVHVEIPSGHYAPRFIVRSPSIEAAPVWSPPQLSPGPKEGRNPRVFGQLSLIAATVLGALVLGIALLTGPTSGSQPALVFEPVGAGAAQDIRIRAGAAQPYIDKQGRVWDPDRHFRGGMAVSAPGQPIWGTRDPEPYQWRREGQFRYDIPLNAGSYELRLHFAEVVYGQGNSGGGGETSRLFDVEVNGKKALEALDVIADAGPNTLHTRVFRDIQPDSSGYLRLAFNPVIAAPFVNGIEITRGTPGRLRPIRLVASDQAYFDRYGRRWEPDTYFRGGQLASRTRVVGNTEDPGLYRGERFGNLTYGIPVPRGRYTVNLHFAEAWFGAENAPPGGSSGRLFDILCNGLALQRSVDIYKEAGGSSRALTKTFRGLQPSPQGKLVLSFLPVKNYACVNAIEVLDEGAK